MKLNFVLAGLIFFGMQTSWGNTTMTTTSVDGVTKNEPKIGVNVEPLWLVLGGLGAKAEYFITDKVSLGVSGFYIPGYKNKKSSSSSASTDENYTLSADEINLGSNIMLTGTLASNGVYINPAIGYQHTKISDYSEFKLEGSTSGPQARLTAGYQWVDHYSGLRIAIGGGLRVLHSSDIVVKDKSGAEVLRQSSSALGGLAIDGHIGYVF
ncbi:MAG: hypothetical protein ACXVCP_00140 [Bdellovibrio sp.]